MNRSTSSSLRAQAFVLCAAFSLASVGQAQDSKTPYPSMAPVDQYLIPDRDAEIALARTAAPPSISNDATVMVLGRHGYETAVEGKNGFVCLVERGWNGSFESDKGFWNPKSRGPDCYNPAAARTVMPIILLRAKLALAGKSKEEMHASIKAAIEKKELPALEPSGMAYMLSKQGFLNDRAGHWLPHVMIFVAVKDNKTWGADLAGSPVMLNTHFNGAPEQVTEFMIPVGEWSDGTPAPNMDAH
jgi:hypothetical protein